MLNIIRSILRPLEETPFHPQWLVKRVEGKLLGYLRSIGEEQVVLDIGCFNKWPKAHIPESCQYIGLDYYETATDWYKTVPDLYGDAMNLPINSEAINTVLLLDVLEHLSDSDMVLSEIYRVLKPGGQLIRQVPFLYPLHDEPRDYVRFTIHGFGQLAKRNGFIIEACNSIGHPVETSVLLTNIAISKTMIRWAKDKNPAAILILLLPVLVLFGNLLARIVRLISSEDDFMPHSYQLMFRKAAS